jgi:hypothetical protein
MTLNVAVRTNKPWTQFPGREPPTEMVYRRVPDHDRPSAMVCSSCTAFFVCTMHASGPRRRAGRLSVCRLFQVTGTCILLEWRERDASTSGQQGLPSMLGRATVMFKIWGFHGGDYEEWRLLGYKNQVRISQETHYVSATESSQLMLCNIWGFQRGDYEECHLLGYKNPVRTSHETHYVSTTEPSQLMLCKIWGFQSGDYEECRLLGYKNPVRTSQETHYVSATESSQLMLRKIWGFHSGDYEECRLLGYKNPVRTSQETHYVPATESSQLMLCKIWGFHGGGSSDMVTKNLKGRESKPKEHEHTSRDTERANSQQVMRQNQINMHKERK